MIYIYIYKKKKFDMKHPKNFIMKFEILYYIGIYT